MLTKTAVHIVAAGFLLVTTTPTLATSAMSSGDWFVDFPRNNTQKAASSFDGKLGKTGVKAGKETSRKTERQKQQQR